MPSPRVWKSRTAQYRQGKLPEHQRRRHSLDGSRDGDSLLTQSISRNSVQEIPSENRPLCLKQIIGKLDLTSTRNFPLRTSPEKNRELSDCRSLPNISDLRLTEVALQNATAYRQNNNQCFKQWSSFPSLERILKANINYSRRKWRHYTEPGKYNQMWRSLGRDVHDHNENRKGEKALCSGLTMHSSGHRKHEHTGTKLTNYSKENLSTQLSRQAKKSTKGVRHWSRRHVLPRILLPD